MATLVEMKWKNTSAGACAVPEQQGVLLLQPAAQYQITALTWDDFTRLLFLQMSLAMLLFKQLWLYRQSGERAKSGPLQVAQQGHKQTDITGTVEKSRCSFNPHHVVWVWLEASWSTEAVSHWVWVSALELRGWRYHAASEETVIKGSCRGPTILHLLHLHDTSQRSACCCHIQLWSSCHKIQKVLSLEPFHFHW